ncbi:MAG: chemotaxis protein CheW [Nitrospira sp.]|nr:chemotaxis protein CheW [Nitrospira sp.]
MNGGLERLRRCASNLAEILVSIDEMQLVTENGQEGLGMGVQEAMTGISSPAFSSRFLIVTVGERYLALNAESICGLMTLEETGNVENPTVHGMVYGAINLADRLSVPHDQDGANARVVLLSEREARASIRVTTVQGLLEFPLSQVLPLPMQFRGPERHWYRGMILFSRSIALVLDTTWLLDERMSGLEGNCGPERTRELVADPKISVNHSPTC